jgi:hypothetical protein
MSSPVSFDVHHRQVKRITDERPTERPQFSRLGNWFPALKLKCRLLNSTLSPFPSTPIKERDCNDSVLHTHAHAHTQISNVQLLPTQSLQNVRSWLISDRADCFRRFQNKTVIQFAAQVHLTQNRIFSSTEILKLQYMNSRTMKHFWTEWIHVLLLQNILLQLQPQPGLSISR